MGRNKVQRISFDSIEEFLENLPEDERIIVDYLRKLVLDAIPNVTEKLAYNVPYFYRHKRICYIWPAAVPWGNTPQFGVRLGFCYGSLLCDETHYLEKGGRKQVYTKTFAEISEIEPDILKAFLFEAVEIDEKWKGR